MKQNPLLVYCRSCGAPAGFDILHQTYRCAHCGGLTDIREAGKAIPAWRDLQRRDRNAPQSARADRTCPNCGAPIRFPAGEASAACEFCGAKLIRPSLEKQRPDLVIPFFLTPDEARARMLAWAQAHQRTPEGRTVLANMDKLEGFYLPYRLVRGPVHASVTRDGSSRRYHCAGYLEGTAVSAAKDLDNLVLDAMEPFDWAAARPFEYGFIAGHKVRLSDISEAEVAARTREEVRSDFLPEVEKVMQTSGIDVGVGTGDLQTLRALLPVYCIHVKKATAVLNGQTGRIAVSGARKKKSYPWVIEPLLYTILSTVLLGIPFHFDIGSMALFAAVFACLFFCIMGDERSALIRSITLRSREARARREDGKLFVEEGRDILQNPYDNRPVFFEPNGKGEDVPVKIRFYSLARLLGILVLMLVLIFLPVIVAAPLRLLIMRGTGEGFLDKFQAGYGGAWYVLMGFIALILYAKGVRQTLYDHPLLYELLPDGKTRFLGRFRDHFLGPLALLGLTVDKSERRSFRETVSDLGGLGWFLILTPLIILIGSVAAILT